MPKSTPDTALQKKLTDFVDANGGVRPAARILKLDHTAVWRFIQFGRAIPRTHRAIRTALIANESATESATIGTAADLSSRGGAQLVEGDLLLLRNFCSSVIALIDNYKGAGNDLAALRG